MDGISRSGGWDKEIPHVVLPMEQFVLSDKWARIMSSMGLEKVGYRCYALEENFYFSLSEFEVFQGADSRSRERATS